MIPLYPDRVPVKCGQFLLYGDKKNYYHFQIAIWESKPKFYQIALGKYYDGAVLLTILSFMLSAAAVLFSSIFRLNFFSENFLFTTLALYLFSSVVFIKDRKTTWSFVAGNHFGPKLESKERAVAEAEKVLNSFGL